jgi:signal transduction histidine kinase
MFPTLRVKLILAFLLAVFVTVALTGLGSFFLLRDQQVRSERERIGQLVVPASLEVEALGVAGVSIDMMRDYLLERARDWKVRFLLVDANFKVLADTENELVGQTFDPTIQRRLTFGEGQLGFRFTNYENGPERQIWYAPPIGPRRVIGSAVERVPVDYGVLMSVPEDRVTGAWKQLLPKLGIPAVVAMLVASLIAYLLARSIARPVSRLTRASEAMTRGQYDQKIPVTSRDELGRLAGAFNAMATQVAGSHQMMQDLLANVAHELKTPLTSIQGFSQALIEGAARTPEDQAQAARIIHEEAERMRRLVEDLLYLSQLESGQLRMEMGAVDVTALLNNSAERVAWQLRDSGRRLRVNVVPGLPPIRGDERRLEQVLANLLDNAIQHTPPGGEISLSAARADRTLTIAVHNTGSYIPPDALARVFERFYRADPARRRDGRNGGLGLSIAQEIAAAHGGRITAASDPDTGTEFRLELPLLAEVEPLGAHGGRSERPTGITARLREKVTGPISVGLRPARTADQTDDVAAFSLMPAVRRKPRVRLPRDNPIDLDQR